MGILSKGLDISPEELEQFFKEHRKPVETSYDVEPFTDQTITKKRSRVYDMHGYWSKKPHQPIKSYILHYTNPGDIILDPFCGSGGSLLMALSLGRKAVGLDLSPSAISIARGFCSIIDLEVLDEAFRTIKQEVYDEIKWLYETRCCICGEKKEISYMVWSDVYPCPDCGAKVVLEAAEKIKYKRGCYTCPDCGHILNTQKANSYEEIPVKVGYRCRLCTDKRILCNPISDYDKDKIEQITCKELEFWYPDKAFPEKFVTDRMTYKGIRKVADFFTSRNLRALTLIRNGINSVLGDYKGKQLEVLRDTLRFLFTSIIINSSKKAQHLDEGGGYIPGNYAIPPVRKERNVWNTFERKYKAIRSGKEITNSTLSGIDIENSAKFAIRDCRHIKEIPSNSVDYVFTDPPYGDVVQFFELNYVWDAWLGQNTFFDKEIVINHHQGKDIKEYQKMMKEALSEIYRVLKPGRWLTLTYHDANVLSWKAVGEAVREVGFHIDDSSEDGFIDSDTGTYQQYIYDKATKRDLIVNLKKLNSGQKGFSEKSKKINKEELKQHILDIVYDFLSNEGLHSLDKIYDKVIAKLFKDGNLDIFDLKEVLKQRPDLFTKEGNKWMVSGKERR